MKPPDRKAQTLYMTDSRRRLRVLLSAYACEPGKGSEAGNGWNWARELSRYEDVWVLTAQTTAR